MAEINSRATALDPRQQFLPPAPLIKPVGQRGGKKQSRRLRENGIANAGQIVGELRGWSLTSAPSSFRGQILDCPESLGRIRRKLRTQKMEVKIRLL